MKNMKVAFGLGPFLLGITAIVNFEVSVPLMLNALALLVSVPLTIYFVFASWKNFLAQIQK